MRRTRFAEKFHTARSARRGDSGQRGLVWRDRLSSAAWAILLAFLVEVAPARADRYSDCRSDQTEERRISGCTKIIGRGRHETVQNRASAYSIRGTAYADRNQFEDAMADFNSAIRLLPKYPWPYAHRGLVHGKMDREKEAIADFTRAIRLDPKFSWAYLNRGFSHFATDSLDSAIADFTKAIALGIRTALVYKARGTTYLKKDQYKLAVTDFSTALELDSTDANLYWLRGLARSSNVVHDAEYDRIIADYSKVIELDPGLTRTKNVYFERADAYRLKGEADRAIADYDAAIEIDPKNASIYHNRASTHSSEKRNDLAIADYTRVIELEPAKTRGYIERAYVHRRRGDNDSAIADFSKAIELDPKEASTYSSRAYAYRDKGDLERAVADFSKAIELEPDNEWKYTDRAETYLQMRNREKAMADYSSAIGIRSKGIRESPDFIFNYYLRGKIHMAMDDYDKAITDFSHAIERDTVEESSLYLQYRGKAYAFKGDSARALADFTTASRSIGKDVDGLFTLARARFDGGDFAGAAADFLRVIELKDDVYAMLYRYVARSRIGESAGAELEANTGRVKTREWPYAVAELYLGRRSPEATLDAARSNYHLCAAHFHIGTWKMLKGDANGASASFETVVDKCPVSFVEHGTARAELRRLAQ